MIYYPPSAGNEGSIVPGACLECTSPIPHQEHKVPCDPLRPKSKPHRCECYVMAYTTMGLRSIRVQKYKNTNPTTYPSHTHSQDTIAIPHHPGVGNKQV